MNFEKKLFVELVYEFEPIRFREPLAEFFGALFEKDMVIEYSLGDIIKMAGHLCPTVALSYIICKKAIKFLYPDGIATRGEIKVIVYGEPDEGVYGVMGQIFSYLTGAAPETGFKGIGYKFKRKNLLQYIREKPDAEAMSFRFIRKDINNAVLISFYPDKVDFPLDKERRISELMERVLWEAAKEEEIKEFQKCWLEKVRYFLEERDINKWLKVERR